jgi:hypothetical protein
MVNGWGKILGVLIPSLIVALLAVAGYVSHQVEGIRAELQENYMPRMEAVVRIDALDIKITEFREEQRAVNQEVLRKLSIQ